MGSGRFFSGLQARSTQVINIVTEKSNPLRGMIRRAMP
jgi:hypothetical protein